MIGVPVICIGYCFADELGRRRNGCHYSPTSGSPGMVKWEGIFQGGQPPHSLNST